MKDHWVRKLQRVVRKYLSQGAALREAARRRYRALLEAANAALAASRKTRYLAAHLNVLLWHCCYTIPHRRKSTTCID